jgi:RND family efflux transporter MFP subunit
MTRKTVPAAPFPRRGVARLCVLASILCAPLALGACDKPAVATSKPADAAPVDLVVTTPTWTQLPRVVRATGTLFGEEEATIASKVSGRIIEIHADLGDRVEPGSPLLRIDPTDYNLERAERANALAETLSRLGLTELVDGHAPADFSIDSVPAVARAILEANNARVRFERARELAERPQPLMGPQEYSDIRTSWEVAQSNVDVERLLAQTILAQARTIEAQVRIAEQRIADTTPLAPAAADAGGTDYEIAQRMVSVGDFVQVGTPLMRLVDSDPIKLRLSIPERRAAEIQRGQTVTIPGGPGGVGAQTGTIARVAPALDIATRTLGIEVDIPNPGNVLRPGAFTSAEIAVGADEALVVPPTAILTFAGVHKVVLVVDGVAQEKRVELGNRTRDAVQILSGLEGNETIALAPPNSITTGTRVRVSADPAPTALAPRE